MYIHFCSINMDRVVPAAVFGQQVVSLRLPSAGSIFSAETNSILLTLKCVTSSDENKFIVCSNFSFLSAAIKTNVIGFYLSVASTR